MESIGVGTYKLNPETTYFIVRKALAIGYRHIDTASLYKNEEAVGRAIRDSGIPRGDIWITTKVRVFEIKKDKIVESIEESLKKLDIGYVDMVLLHNPVPDKIESSWQTLEDYYFENSHLVKYIGVSNYDVCDLERLKKVWRIVPHCNQIEVHPFLRREELVKWCQDNGIRIVAHTSLLRGQVFEKDLLVRLGEKYQVHPSQILLTWALAKGYGIIPGTTAEDHLLTNYGVKKLVLEEEDIQRLDTIEETICLLPRRG